MILNHFFSGSGPPGLLGHLPILNYHPTLTIQSPPNSKMPLTRFELVTSPLPRECSTPEPQGLMDNIIIVKVLKKPVIGIEPTTYGLQNRCSTVELYRQQNYCIKDIVNCQYFCLMHQFLLCFHLRKNAHPI